MANCLGHAALVLVVTTSAVVEEQKRCNIDFENRTTVNFQETIVNPMPAAARDCKLPGMHDLSATDGAEDVAEQQ